MTTTIVSPFPLIFLLILAALIFWAVKSPSGRWALGIAGGLLVLFVLSYIVLRVRNVNPHPVRIQTVNDYETWKRNAVIAPQQVLPPAPFGAPRPLSTPDSSRVELSAGPFKLWVEDHGGSQRLSGTMGQISMDLDVPGPQGEIVGYSGLEPTEEEALKAARASLGEKLKALVKLEIVRTSGDSSDPDLWGKVDLLIARSLNPQSMEVDSFQEAVRLPQSGNTSHRAAVLARLPETQVPEIASQVTRTAREMKDQAREARRTWAWTIASALVLALFMFIIYSFLNAGTKGHLAWPLRIISITAFALLAAGLLIVRGHLS